MSKIWYLCDGEKQDCKKRTCYKNTTGNACRLTSDINHAKNFIKTKNGDHANYREIDRNLKGTADRTSKRTYNMEKLYAGPSISSDAGVGNGLVEVKLEIFLNASDWCKFQSQSFYQELIQYLDNLETKN